MRIINSLICILAIAHSSHVLAEGLGLIDFKGYVYTELDADLMGSDDEFIYTGNEAEVTMMLASQAYYVGLSVAAAEFENAYGKDKELSSSESLTWYALGLAASGPINETLFWADIQLMVKQATLVFDDEDDSLDKEQTYLGYGVKLGLSIRPSWSLSPFVGVSMDISKFSSGEDKDNENAILLDFTSFGFSGVLGLSLML